MAVLLVWRIGVSMHDLEVLQATTALIAVVLGFLLSQLAEWARGRRSDSRRRRSVRRLVQLEKRKNLEEVRRLWENVLGSRDEWMSEQGKFLFVELARRIADTPFPVIQKEAWRANLPYLAGTFEEDELEREWGVYEKIDRLQAIYLFFVDANNERVEAYRHDSAIQGRATLSVISGLSFADSVKRYAVEFKDLVELVLELKNAEEGGNKERRGHP